MNSPLSLDGFSSGIWDQQYGYKSFHPEFIDREWIISNPEIQELLSNADRAIGELNAFGLIVPDVDFFIKMHIAKEATFSNRIEGTQTEFGEALLSKLDIRPESRNDWEEVQNYIKAINFAIEALERLPLSTRLLKQTHAQLLQGVGGKHKQSGEYRISQNWIGGATLKDAVFIPPHHQYIGELMGDLENFLNNPNIHTPHLIRIAIAHYQFETIHPFLDGNGRLGRLLITLYLVRYGLISKPSLYLSDFLEKNKSHYYDNLTAVRSRNDLQHWIKFFLVGVTETAKNSSDTFREIIKLREKIETQLIPTLGKRASLGLSFMRALYKNPIVNIVETASQLQTSKATVNRLIADFERLGILSEITGFRRNRLFVFKNYIDLFSKRN